MAKFPAPFYLSAQNAKVRSTALRRVVPRIEKSPAQAGTTNFMLRALDGPAQDAHLNEMR
jgi:hypothetical protein